jgi:hypothetical protein
MVQTKRDRERAEERLKTRKIAEKVLLGFPSKSYLRLSDAFTGSFLDIT